MIVGVETVVMPGNRFFVIVAFIVWMFAHVSVENYLVQHGMSARLASGFGVLPGIFLVWLWFKLILLGNMPRDLIYSPCYPEDQEGLDLRELANKSGEFEALGFIRLEDYSITGKASRPIHCFVRVFVHPEHNCFGEVGQTLKPMRVHAWCEISSCLSEGWRLMSVARRPMGGIWVLRTPRVLWSFNPGISLEELLKIHLEKRETVVGGLGINVIKDLTTDSFMVKEQSALQQQKARIKRRSVVFVFLESLLFPFFPRYEWWGDYPKLAKKSKQ